MPDTPILQVENLSKFFPVQRGLLRRTVGHVKAVNDVTFTVNKGECLGLVGESGCGKTTVARCLLRLVEPDQGRILLHGERQTFDIASASRKEMLDVRRQMQIIFQDPFSSLDPRWRVTDVIAEPLMAQKVGRGEAGRRVLEILPTVGLGPHFADRFPHELSGGERQRVSIARALIVSPPLVVADEPVSALDVSVRSQIINLLLDLQSQMNLTYVFIAHDLSIVKHISHRIAVMYLGRLVELGTTQQVFEECKHPYTKALLASVLIPDPTHREQSYVLEGEVPSPLNPPSGCHFSTRCPFAQEQCSAEEPELRDMGDGHWVRCHFAEELDLSEEIFAPQFDTPTASN
ncbi:MAG: ATP-binding cassette domain-containing protein [Caldilineaceae bacterium SB0670_bin_27]|uniref:ATP-binding cassette domain-containing protein n=1 Tax=Caldilineaceae bacterium SB0664_bin_27 TaxID=2605260 RepID=A0A6B0YTR9_9CHLR|nr:ATP-binding cassette domain-containing protein [Caldilineaceae bacterium]MDE0338219.1 ATP-binding cassette domain-containing protein [Caldilineaceae bacterium]MXY94504.1 ATP-binding cassette domain-containing protein [Caldilineaceae bacterium SB0664_bin_27]MYJ79244.1 ATP-binding cassette domain-containing protein [Caldilineaceae bacterium SB0670_bin_27]